jgi:predicted phage tail protein
MGFVQGIDESIGLGNALGGVLGILAAKAAITATRTAVLTAMQLGLFNAKTAAVTMGFGVAASMILAGSIMAMVASQTSQAKSLASAEEGGITTTEGIVNVHPQEAIVPISMLSKFIADAMKPIHSELRQTRRENSNYFGIGGSAIRGIGSRVGTVLEETA